MGDPKVAYVADVGGHHVSVDMPRDPPRLSVALFWAKPGQYPAWQTDLEKTGQQVDLGDPTKFSAEVGRLLTHIYQRLEKGLDEAWISRFGYGAPQPQQKAGSTAQQSAEERQKAWDGAVGLKAQWNEPEEQWARIFSEMFVYTSYAGIGQMMLGGGTHDGDIYKEWPKVYATIGACQHLCTYGALSRGSDAADVGNGMTAGPNGLVNVFKESKDKGTPKRAAWLKDAIPAYEKHNLGSGDVASGSENAAQTGWAHAASVLRRWPLGAKASAAAAGAAKLQMFDTGVLANQGDSNTQDHGWLEKNKLPNAFAKARGPGRSGLGKLPTPGALATAVETTKKALPLGFARLLIVEPSGKALYVSAMLPMWHGTHRFTIARYIWSLRDLPAKGGVRAYWVFFTPIGQPLFDEVVKEAAAPTRSAEALARAAVPSLKGGTSRPFRPTAACTNEPKVFRAVIKSDEKWNAVSGREEPNPTSTAAPTKHETFYDHAAEQKAYNEAKDKSKLKPPGRPRYPFKRKLDLKLDADPASHRPGGWDFLDAWDHIGTELWREGDQLVAKPAASNAAPYFNGK